MTTLEKHRVRLFVHDEKESLDKDELFWKIADLFQVTEKCKWAQTNGIQLHYEVHDDTKWHGIGSQTLIYAELDAGQYSDYILNFYEFEAENWK